MTTDEAATVIASAERGRRARARAQSRRKVSEALRRKERRFWESLLRYRSLFTWYASLAHRRRAVVRLHRRAHVQQQLVVRAAAACRGGLRSREGPGVVLLAVRQRNDPTQGGGRHREK